MGYRTTLFNSLFLDMGYYFSRYKDFIGYQLGVDAFIPQGSALPTTVQAYRISSNATDIVTSQGFSIGANYFSRKYVLKGNYSWNVLNTQSDDPIIPAFNTPENKYNIGLSARDMSLFGLKISDLMSTINGFRDFNLRDHHNLPDLYQATILQTHK